MGKMVHAEIAAEGRKKRRLFRPSGAVPRHSALPWLAPWATRLAPLTGLCAGVRSFYSARNADIGSMRDARHAGTYPATAATSVSTTSIPLNVAMSPGCTP